MSSQTTNLHLVKPADGETADIGVINGNMDTIDTAIGSLRESVSHGDVTFDSIASGSYGDKSITFATAMPSTPHVVAMRTDAGTTGYNIQLATFNVSSSGAKIRCWNFGNTAITPKVSWVAVC